jgi:hypothetical protein
MSLLVNGMLGQLGAYWASAATTIGFQTYGDLDGDPCTTLGNGPYTFGPVEYWQSNGSTSATPIVGTINPCTGPIAAANQAVIVGNNVLVPGWGYVITAQDALENRDKWWIDILPMRIDPYTIPAGATVSVLIELIGSETGGVCSDCEVICECTVDVAIACCGDDVEIPMPEKFGMYFPYVTWQGLWSTGIVVSNISSIIPYPEFVVAAEDMELTLVLHDAAGNTFTFFKDDFTTTSWGFDMGSLLPSFSGTPVAGPAWLEVQSNFLIDGYSYIQNTVFGLGTLPRQWSTVIEMMKQYTESFDVDPMTIFSGAGIKF